MNSEIQPPTPYSSLEEHLSDCLSWLDEYLDYCSNPENLPGQSFASFGRRLLARQEATPENLLPLTRLSHKLHLTEFESFLVLLALAPELDLKYEFIYSSLQGNPACLHPTLGLAKNLYSFWQPVTLSQLDAITDSRSLLNQYLFDQNAACADGDTTLHRNLVLKRITLRYLLGRDSTQAAMTLPAETKLLPAASVSDFVCYPSQYQRIRRSLSSLEETAGKPSQNRMLFYLSGPKGIGRKYLLSQLLKDGQRQAICVNMRSLCRLEADKLQTALEHLALEAFLWDRFLYLDNISPERDDTFCLPQTISYLLKSCPVLFLSSQDDKLPDLTGCEALLIRIPFSIPDSTVRARLWMNLGSCYPFDKDTNLEAFGWQYRLTPGQTAGLLAQAAETARGLGVAHIPSSALTAAISQNQHLAFQFLASKIEHTYTWDDLQLAPAARKLLHSALNRVMMRHLVEEQWGFGQKSPYGKGLSLLFYGPPGTGKTMAAQVIAHESGLELYRVDVSQIFNKYIGETEKNIGRIFEEAKKADIILFFDEADSLFSKRTEVSNSNDRHSNAEIAYLLQKMEEYNGITILSTNLYQNFDSAFLRRLTYTVYFDMPSPEIRLNLWKSMIPADAPVSPQIDFNRLARQFELSGSSIKSVLRGAAYLAAETHSNIQTKHIIQAIKYEYLKTGKIISNEEFGEYSIYL